MTLKELVLLAEAKALLETAVVVVPVGAGGMVAVGAVAVGAAGALVTTGVVLSLFSLPAEVGAAEGATLVGLGETTAAAAAVTPVAAIFSRCSLS
jgi:hypothetical protein